MKTKFKPNYVVHPGELLKSDLKTLKMTKRKLSKKTGIPISTIKAIIRGEKDINMTSLLTTF
jgi:plasmid maintenance system antidote protein VapI